MKSVAAQLQAIERLQCQVPGLLVESPWHGARPRNFNAAGGDVCRHARSRSSRHRINGRFRLCPLLWQVPHPSAQVDERDIRHREKMRQREVRCVRAQAKVG